MFFSGEYNMLKADTQTDEIQRKGTLGVILHFNSGRAFIVPFSVEIYYFAKKTKAPCRAYCFCTSSMKTFGLIISKKPTKQKLP